MAELVGVVTLLPRRDEVAQQAIKAEGARAAAEAVKRATLRRRLRKVQRLPDQELIA